MNESESSAIGVKGATVEERMKELLSMGTQVKESLVDRTHVVEAASYEVWDAKSVFAAVAAYSGAADWVEKPHLYAAHRGLMGDLDAGDWKDVITLGSISVLFVLR